MNYFIYAENLIGVSINKDSFGWSYGVCAPRTTEDVYNQCVVKIKIDVVDDKDVLFQLDREKDLIRFNYFYGKENGTTIFYDRAFIGGKRLSYKIDIDENTVNVTVGKTYLRYVKSRIMNLHSMNNILFDLTGALLVKKGYVSLYCSAVRHGENCTLIFSPPSTGKTVTAVRLAKEKNFNILSEDIVITNGEIIWAVPWTSSFREYGSKNNFLYMKVIRKLAVFIPLEIFRGADKKSITDVVEKVKIVSKAIAKNVVILEQGQDKVSNIVPDVLYRVKALNRYLFNYERSPFLQVLGYFNQDYSLEIIRTFEADIMQKTLEKIQPMIVQSTKAERFTDIICDLLSNG